MIILLVSLILPVLTLFFFYRHKNPQKARYPPGPLGLPLIGNLHQLAATTSPHIYLWKLSKKYGPLMSMKLGSVPLIVISSAKTAKYVYKTHDLAFSSRPKVRGQHKLSYNGLDIAFAPYIDSWRELRKICVLHLLSNKQVQSFRPVREDEVFRMIKNLSVKSGQAANLSETMLLLTSTLICRTAFSKRENDDRRKFDGLMLESQAMMGSFFVSDYLPSFGWVDKLSGLIDRLEKIFNKLEEFYRELIDEHLDPSRQKAANPDLLDLLIQLKEDKSCSVELTWDHIKAILMDIFIAATDTSAATVIWTMTALMKNPTIMEKLQNEIREAIGEQGNVNESDLPKLSYLKAVIKEVLRLYPPTPLSLPRETLENCTVEGYLIPARTLVYINAWAIARDPEYWERPEEFVPERFLNTSVDIIGQDFQVIPFGGGRRRCPGIWMGLATVELAVANLLYSFDWEMPYGMKKEDIDTQVLPGLTMHKKNPLFLVPKKYKYI
ncbi:Cytochrome P450 CYP2 subfamily [Handroanthus impetiginosus]|uniref:Cytochrome P450 CYP2 subfamily n=1 Tax=Handroanthus impetiginosus TaxID=429701 RepID=A0A2G9GSE7_9LAMI|nr:Cytochrome P450 CYP2 subfamily [Handroanthus impetiginosus]